MSTNGALSNNNSNEIPNPIIMGVRVSAELFGKVRYQTKTTKKNDEEIEGFCKEFGDKLARNLNREVKYKSIVNDHVGSQFHRYNGLRAGLIHLECGPNTIFEPVEKAINNEDKWKENILFSNKLYETGIKLLLNEKLFNELTQLKEEDSSRYNARLHSIKIVLIEGTTTYDEFKLISNNPNQKYNFFHVPKK